MSYPEESIPGDMVESRYLEWAACMEGPSATINSSSPFVTYDDFSCHPNHLTTKDTVASATMQVGEQEGNDLGLSLQCTQTIEPTNANATATANTAGSPSYTGCDEALTMGLDWPEQAGLLMDCELMDCDASLTLKGGGNNNNVPVPDPVPASITDKPKKRKRGGVLVTGTAGSSISLVQLEQLFCKPRKEAADILQVSVSHLKCICRQYGIARWPFKKKNKVVHVSCPRNNYTCSTGPDPKKSIAKAATNVIQTSPPPAAELAMQDARLITFKANCGDFFIRFELSSPSKMVDVKQQVAKRLQLKMEKFNISYLDEDNNWILMTCDDDLQYCIRLLGRTTIIINIRPITKLMNLISEFM